MSRSRTGGKCDICHQFLNHGAEKRERRAVTAVAAGSVRRGYLEGLVFYAVTFGASLLTIDPANERGSALFDALVRRTFAAVDDLDAGSAMGLDAQI